MYDFNLLFLSGGYHTCYHDWNAEPSGRDNCYKLYFVVEGEARVEAGGAWHDLTEGNVYYINGFKLLKQRCDKLMKVYWLHFIPESLLVNMYLNEVEAVHSWRQGDSLPDCIDFRRIPDMFDKPLLEDNRMRRLPLSMASHIHFMTWFLLQDMLDKQKADTHGNFYDMYAKMKPAIDYMDNHYRDNITLTDISQQTFLNASYFVRVFKQTFKITPYRYIIMKRLNQACRLLLSTDMSIQEIAESTGFSNQFYFSKVFKEQFYKSPSVYRSSKLLP